MAEDSVDLSRFERPFKDGYNVCPEREGWYSSYERALQEIRNGQKCTCWMWWIFPIFKGWKNASKNNKFYAIKSLEEAKAFLAHPYYGKCLREISEALLQLETSDPFYVFGPLDEPKLKSSMTLFDYVDGNPNNVFAKVLEKYFNGERSEETLKSLREES